MIELWHRFTENTALRRTVVLVALCLVLYWVRGIISLLLLTFIFTYLMVRLIGIIHKFSRIPEKIVAVLVYLIVLIFLYFSITIYVPKLFSQTLTMIEEVVSFYQKMSKSTDNKLVDWIFSVVSISEIKQQLTSGVKVVFTTITSIGSMGLTFFMSLILSFFFIIEKEWVESFGRGFFQSKIKTISQDIAFLGKKFVDTFGVVIEAQFIIACVNTLLTTIGLLIMKFPQNQMLSLALMIFIFSLIPVAGVIISCVPLSLIAYTIGGIQDVVYVLIMITLIHALESYLLNPKLMSSKTDLPVFFVFIVLMISQKFFGVWGLIVGIPVFVFVLDLLGVKSEKPHQQKKIKLLSKT